MAFDSWGLLPPHRNCLHYRLKSHVIILRSLMMFSSVHLRFINSQIVFHQHKPHNVHFSGDN